MNALQAMPDVFSVKRIQTSYAASNNSNFTKKNTKTKRSNKKN